MLKLNLSEQKEWHIKSKIYQTTSLFDVLFYTYMHGVNLIKYNININVEIAQNAVT